MARRYSKKSTRSYRSKSTFKRTKVRSSGKSYRSSSGPRRIELVIRSESAQPGVVNLQGFGPAVPTSAPRKASF